MKIHFEVAQHRLIYIFAARDDAHRELLKIGETTITTEIPAEKLKPNCNELNRAANARINQYMRTAGVAFKLLHTELAVDNKNNSFRDYDVHRVLKKSGVKQGNIGREWFRVDLPTAIRAVAAVKQGKKFLAGIRAEIFREKIIFRPEQETAIDRTVKYFRLGKDFLWNAKMRFGKTLCALEVVRRINFAKTIIVTHRPVVNAGWFDDFRKIFGGNDNFIYGKKGSSVKELLASKKNFVYFASIQDLRGSETVGGKFDKNHEVFKLPWDFVIVDEAHEGTQTALGDAVIKKLVKKKTKFLALSGTPFNILNDYDADSVYTWDYVMEQRAKADWEKKYPCDSNPYADLPRMNIFTYNLGKLSKYFDMQDMSFSFREFFRTDNESFVHEDDVKSFLDLLTTESDSDYPFSRADFREMFRHTLWIVPGVKEGRALSSLLKNHRVFKHFQIVNVAGNGDSNDEPANALDKVRNAIDNNDYTITLSCGKLTVGVTVPEWTAVLYLSGGYSTSAATYQQTIFRVQSPCNKGGVSKQNCYVFDFAPDRALRVIADSVKASRRAGQTTDEQRRDLGDLLNFCPVIAVEGSEMKALDANKLLRKIKRVYAERIVNKGFDDSYLYNNTLLNLTDVDWEKFKELKKIVGVSKAPKAVVEVPVNEQGLTNEQHEGDTPPTTRKPRTDEEKEAARKAAVKRNAISILRGISIRMPLLIYGAEVPFDEDITIDKFAEIVDDASWEEFMPKGVTKKFFGDFIKYYDPENFINAGRIVRKRAKKADSLKPTDRVKEIAALFATFKNPDKETVLTPWRVVNLHLGEVFGGYVFGEDDLPQHRPTDVFTPDKKILEINSKTGLYPLYVAYSIYRARLGEVNENSVPLDELRRLWDKTVAENVFVICKTPMAKTITRRTLLGYRQGLVNAHCFDNLINQLKNKPLLFLWRVTNKNFWSKGVGKMFFEAVVGNPPYQVAAQGENVNYNSPVYHEFIKAAYDENLTKHASLIHPARFLFNAGDTPKDFVEKFLNDKHVRIVRYEPDAKKLFSTSEIKGGIAITEFDATKNFGSIGTFIPFDELISIHQKVVVDNSNFRPLSEIISTPVAYRLSENFFSKRPELISKLQKPEDSALRSNIFERLPEIFFDNEPNDGAEYVQIYGLVSRRRVFKWVRRDLVNAPGLLDKYKVFVPESNSAGALGEVVSTPLVGSPLVGSPLVGSTQTFITVGAFDTRAEAEACIAYIKSKFCRVLLGILKVTQHNPPQTWAKVPLQDFTSKSDIDWSLSIPEIDAQLYRKYGLNAAETEFIESHVKAMT